MYKKCVSIVVFLCLLVVGNGAYGVFRDIGIDGAETRYQDDWHNGLTTIPAVNPGDSNFNNPLNWGIQRNTNRPPGTTGDYWDPSIYHRPPTMNVWACLEGKYPEPNIIEGNVACSRLSIYPWPGDVGPGQGFALTVERNAVDINCGVQIGLGDKENWNSADKGYVILNVFGGTMYTPGYNSTTAEPHIYCPPSGLYIGGGPITGGSAGGNGQGLNYGTVNMYGGSIIVPGVRINYGDVNLLYKDYGDGNVTHGLLYNTADADSNFVISPAHAMDKINIEGNGEVSGELRLKGDRAAQVEDFYKTGRICACWGHGILFVDYNTADNYTSVTAECTPGSAWNPTPTDKKNRVALGQILSWSPGDWVQDACDPNGTGTHAVYLGTSEVNVTEANEVNQMGVYKGRWDANSYDPCGLPAGVACYWRIDEYNEAGGPDGNTMWKGEVWEFQTVGGEAIDPVPRSGAVGLPVPLQLSWTPGVFVADTNGHDVYFGTNEGDVTADSNANLKGTYRGRQTSNVFLLSSLPFDLVPDTNYYWRIDEVNPAHAPYIWQSETWMFTNTNYFIIDDFGSYDSSEELLARWDTGDVYESCSAKYPAGEIGWAYSAENGTMQFDYDNQHGSDYCGSCYFSEVRFDANGADWTGGGALPNNDKAGILSVSYIGGPRNSKDNPSDPNYDRMYVAIEDTATNFGSIILNSDPEGQRTSVQKQWKVSLYDLNSPDVNLKAVKYLYLGFGIRCNAGLQGGTGTVMFDDIRLYQRHCVPEHSGLTADLSGNCRVDLDDVNILADEWLSKQTIVTPNEPNNTDVNLMLWYKFDDTTGKVVTDSSGHNYKGDVNVKSGVADDSWWDTTGGYDGNGCINMILDFNTVVEANKAALDFLDTNNALTISVWVNADVYSPPDWWARLVSVRNQDTDEDNKNEVMEIDCPSARPPSTTNGPFVRFIVPPEPNGKAGSEEMEISDFGGGWHHYAFVKDADVNLMRVYHNGEVVADDINESPMFELPIETFRIGDWDRGGVPTPEGRTWIGRIDDFRVYDYALSQEEVAWLRGTGYVPFDAKANLRSSMPETIDFGDLAILAQQWLNEHLWP